MTVAEIRGKIWRGGENLSEGLEDLLTSDVFGCLRYLPPQSVLLPFLGTAWSPNGKKLPLDFKTDKMHFSFWPWLESHGRRPCEPDVVIGLEEQGRAIHILAIEAKYFSGKSSEEDEREQSEQPNDQLARELDNLEGVTPVALRWNTALPIMSRALLFVTQDMIMPRADIAKSLADYSNKRHKDGDIFWTSWRFLPSIIKEAIDKENIPEYRAVMEDMLKLLLRKELTMFEGVEPISRSFALPQFYRPSLMTYRWPVIPELSKAWEYYYKG